MASEGSPGGISRRSFVKYAALGGLVAVGAYSAYKFPEGWDKWLRYGQKDWELAPGVVDYDYVMKHGYGPTSLGFENDIRDSPPSARILNVAQWYDYWPGKTVIDFARYMETKWGVTGVVVNWTSNIYTSNEELFTWVTQTGRKFDVMFPTNYTVETLEKAGLLVNMNKDWIPNYVNIFGPVPTAFPPRFEARRSDLVPEAQDYPQYANGFNNEAGVDYRTPALNGYAYRMNTETYPNPRGTEYFTWDERNSLIAIPYQWGTTGIGYRTDIFRKEDIERLGWAVFELSSYTNPEWLNPRTGQKEPKTFSLTKKRMLLDDMREVYTGALKAVGWKNQEAFRAQGLTTADPTAITKNRAPPYDAAPFNGDYQWSNNETEDPKLQDSMDWLLSFRGDMFGFNTPQQGPWLVSGTMSVDQAWSGDVMYAVRPNTDQFVPVDYFVPKEGGARWIDNATIHRESEKLWLSHEFLNYILDPVVGAVISSWNLYASPNAWSFKLLRYDDAYSFHGFYPDGTTPYNWNPAAEHRIYSDIALGMYGDATLGRYQGQPILPRCEYQKDVGVRNTLKYFRYWRAVKY